MRVCLLVLLCGCRSILGIDDVSVVAPPDDGPRDDGEYFDAPIDAPSNGLTCYGKHAVKVCIPQQTQTLTLPLVIDTSIDSSCTQIQPQSAPPSLCVISAKSITSNPVTSTRVVGSRPLVLLATETIIIAGTIDVSSRRATGNGAGANTGTCSPATVGQSGIGTLAGGGGSGGALGFSGGAGGAGAGGAQGGVASIKPILSVLRGGCPGAVGGKSGNSLASGAAGAGGGAVYFLSGGQIEVRADARINASGAGGGASQTQAGGAGGGSGGIIGFEALAIAIDPLARIYAIGGGGSTGGGANAAGVAGGEALDPMPTTAAIGNDSNGDGGVGTGGNGGTGQVGMLVAGGGGGGGGGGGSGGAIWFSPDLPASANILPAPTAPP